MAEIPFKSAEKDPATEPETTPRQLTLEMRGTDRYIEHYRHQLGLDPGEQAS